MSEGRVFQIMEAAIAKLHEWKHVRTRARDTTLTSLHLSAYSFFERNKFVHEPETNTKQFGVVSAFYFCSLHVWGACSPCMKRAKFFSAGVICWAVHYYEVVLWP